MKQLSELAPRLAKWRLLCLLVGIVGAVLSAIGAEREPAAFYSAYLVSYLYWLGIALGCWAIALIHHLTGGGWGLAVRRILEAAYGTLPLLAMLYLPLMFGYEHLYPWSTTEGASEHAVQAKSAYLNLDFFKTRLVIYFAVWLFIPILLSRWSAARTIEAEARQARWRQMLSGPGLVLYGLTVTFASIDWAMSIEPQWYSSMYPVLFIAGFAVSGLSFAILAGVLLAPYHPWRESSSRQRWHDLGNLLLAMVMFWAYVSIMQYMIIWSGNLPEETPWYLHRSTGGWQYLVYGLVVCHFILPFFLLLMRDVKRRTSRLALVALLLLGMRAVDLYWLVMPSLAPAGLTVHWLSLATFATVGGFFLTVFTWQLPRRSALPTFDIQTAEEVHDGSTAYAS